LALEDEAIFAWLQGAHAVGEGLGKHGDGAIEEVNGVAAEAGFAVERGFGRDVVGDVGDVDLQKPAAVFAAFDVDRRRRSRARFHINGDDGQAANNPRGRIDRARKRGGRVVRLRGRLRRETCAAGGACG